MTREAESERFEDAVLLALKMEEGYHEPINAGSLHKLEKQGDRFFFFPGASRKEHSPADFSPLSPM